MIEDIVGIDDPDLQAMFKPVLGPRPYFGAATALGFRDEEGFIGGWLFERYTGEGGSVVAHWAGRDARWLSRDKLVMCALYLFDQLAVNIVYGEVRASRFDVRAIDEKLGFKEVAYLEGYFPGDDLVIYAMRRDECRWLPAECKET